MTSMGTDPPCKLCGNDQAWHREHTEIAHRYYPPDGDLSNLNGKREKREEKKPVAMPGDPVLRIALMKAGLLTPQQIEEAKHDFESGNPIVILVDKSDLPDGVGSTGSD
jgi:hypothetical protein